jgi:hypothetical protein
MERSAARLSNNATNAPAWFGELVLSGRIVQYKLFCKGTGLRVSQMALGTALFGTAWGYGDAR